MNKNIIVKELKKYFIIVFLLVTFPKCMYDPPRHGISVLNYTGSAIYVSYSLNDSINSNNKLELFETYNYNNSKHIVSPHYRIDACNIGSIGVSGREELLNESPDKKIRLFFISEKTMRSKTWKEIINKKEYIKKVTISIDDLKNKNWMVRYY
jgi:hypothetical protein